MYQLTLIVLSDQSQTQLFIKQQIPVKARDEDQTFYFVFRQKNHHECWEIHYIIIE